MIHWSTKKISHALSLLIFNFTICLSQEKIKEIEFSADRIKYVQEIKGGAQRLIGNVQFIHEGVIITCDSAYRFDNNSIEAYDHIMIRKGDSLRITGDKLAYDGNTKLAKIQGKVLCVEKDMTLSTDELNFDVKKSIASYYNGGTITSKNNTLKSKHGYYDSPSKMLSFRYGVVLQNPEYKMECDTLKYHTLSKIAYFLGPTTINSKKNKLFCENGWYNTTTEKCMISKNAKIESMPNTLSSDSLFYDRKLGYGKAYSRVVLSDTTQKFILKGNLAETFEKKGISIFSQNPKLIQPLKKDTLYLKADSIVSYENRFVIKQGEKKITIDSSSIKLFHSIRFFKKDLMGMADSAVYTYSDSSLNLFKSPVIWSDSSQATAKTIKIITTKNNVKYMELLGNAFFILMEDSLKFNQLSGKTVKAFFKNDSLDRIILSGNAKAIYYMKNEKKKFIGVNQTECKEIRASFKKGGALKNVSFLDKPSSKITPIADSDPEKLRLKGFIWLEKYKPKNKEEILLQP